MKRLTLILVVFVFSCSNIDQKATIEQSLIGQSFDFTFLPISDDHTEKEVAVIMNRINTSIDFKEGEFIQRQNNQMAKGQWTIKNDSLYLDTEAFALVQSGSRIHLVNDQFNIELTPIN